MIDNDNSWSATLSNLSLSPNVTNLAQCLCVADYLSAAVFRKIVKQDPDVHSAPSTKVLAFGHTRWLQTRDLQLSCELL